MVKDTIFNDTFTLESGLANNAINLEVPLTHLHRALKSAQNANASSASIRLTKKAGVPLLSLTITTSSLSSHVTSNDASDLDNRPDRETVVTQDIPVRVLSEQSVAGLHEPLCREPDVHIMLPDLSRLKSISDRMTKLALGKKASTGPRLVLKANMHGCLSLALEMDDYVIRSVWTGLTNPELDPEALAEGARAVEEHPSTRMKRVGDAEGLSTEGWATVRVEGRDWGKVLGVGRLGGRVIACESRGHGLLSS